MRPGELRRRTAVHAALVLALTHARGNAQQEQIGKYALPTLATYFADFEAASKRDGGALWGVEIYGPLLVLDPIAQTMAGNRADALGKLRALGGVHFGALPREIPPANAPAEWAGERWAVTLVSFLGETTEERVSLFAHESFHRVQMSLGLYVFGEENEHLDGLEGRLWLQLEWNALESALAAQGEARVSAARDALDFRAARHARVPAARARETKLELREGLASYTGLRIAGYDAAGALAATRARRAKEETFVRSFAYLSGPYYGYLLDEAAPAWRTHLTGESDLAALLSEALRLEPSAARAEERAPAYGATALRASEEARESARQARLAAWRASLVDGPVLIVDLALVASRTVDTRKVFPFDAGRTVFTERKLIGRFGALEVHEGAILEDAQRREGRVTLTGSAADHLSGPGWSLKLAPGWSVVAGERAGDFCLRAP
jgi:hypothetical protein